MSCVVLIDLDGACFNPSHAIQKTAASVLEQYQGRQSVPAYCCDNGGSLGRYFADHLNLHPFDPLVIEALELFAWRYENWGHLDWRMYSGVESALRRLSKRDQCHLVGFSRLKHSAYFNLCESCPALRQVEHCEISQMASLMDQLKCCLSVMITNRLDLSLFARKYNVGTIFAAYSHASWRYLRSVGAMFLANEASSLPALAHLYFAHSDEQAAICEANIL